MRMKAITLSLLGLLTLTTASCTSEYEECLEQGRCLKEKLVEAQSSNALRSSDNLVAEIELIQKEIILLSKVSGNEELFLRQIYKD